MLSKDILFFFLHYITRMLHTYAHILLIFKIKMTKSHTALES